MKNKELEPFETGPIRPPSEAGSYLIRLTRGCPWNRCTFCRTYKRRPFSIREVEEVIADIDKMAEIRDELREGKTLAGTEGAWMVANAMRSGGKTAFLQDGDSLAMKPEKVRAILSHLKKLFPEVERITTYARSRTMANRSVEDLKSYLELGLNRIHIGMETGHDPLLEVIKKGVTGDIHVKGGRRVVEAGMELSEYLMPGLGGRTMTEGHAADSANVLNQINPNFIRLRTICLGPKLQLWDEFESGRLVRMTDVEIVREIKRFIEALTVKGTRLVSDHILNLLGDLEGNLPEEKDTLLAIIDEFLGLDEETQHLFQVARRSGILTSIADLERGSVSRRAQALLDDIYKRYGKDGVDAATREMMERFV
ncbi:MAG: radical SAM protein [Deltaproteobacteria bacterium]|nr:MAG: radical SAM protein [Deltaproteobacteria bacterium]